MCLQYGAIMIVDPEEEVHEEEVVALAAHVGIHGLGLVVFGEWYNVDNMVKMRFFDDNTRSWWTPVTGESAHTHACRDGLSALGKHTLCMSKASDSLACRQVQASHLLLGIHLAMACVLVSVLAQARSSALSGPFHLQPRQSSKHALHGPAGGANVPALNQLLDPFGIAFGDAVLEGQLTLDSDKLFYASGANIARFPAGGYIHSAPLADKAVTGASSHAPGMSAECLECSCRLGSFQRGRSSSSNESAAHDKCAACR